jgi:chorismate synthase
MDPVRYQTLLANNQQLEARVAQLEAQPTVQRNETYAPTNLDRDLMYSDQYVNQSYSNRPTTGGRVAFWVFAVPAGIGCSLFFIWLIWFKRWQSAT